MNEFDSIKRFINIIFIIIILCIFIIALFEITYAIKMQQISFTTIFNVFLVYFMIDLMKDVNDEKNLFIEKHYTIANYRVVRIKKIYN